MAPDGSGLVGRRRLPKRHRNWQRSARRTAPKQLLSRLPSGAARLSLTALIDRTLRAVLRQPLTSATPPRYATGTRISLMPSLLIAGFHPPTLKTPTRSCSGGIIQRIHGCVDECYRQWAYQKSETRRGRSPPHYFADAWLPVRPGTDTALDAWPHPGDDRTCGVRLGRSSVGEKPVSQAMNRGDTTSSAEFSEL